jgi:hypothetical protein
MSGALGALAELCQPLYKAMKRLVAVEGYLQADKGNDKDPRQRDIRKMSYRLLLGLSPPRRGLVYFHYAESRDLLGAHQLVSYE